MKYELPHELKESIKNLLLGSCHPKYTTEVVLSNIQALEQLKPIVEENMSQNTLEA